LAATHHFPLFTAEFADPSGARRQEAVSQAAVFRVPSLGWPIGSLTPQASLERDDMQILLFKTRRRLRYMQYSLRSAFNLPRATPEIESLEGRELLCSASSSSSEKIYAQADGEPLGTLPVRISMAEKKVILLFPASSKASSQ
jgi:diacylglycerol kinase family enzyme